MATRVTSWTLIDAALKGDELARARFAQEYEPAVRAYFRARWRSGALSHEIDDAVQEVWLDCLRADGALQRADPGRPFRPFLAGVARNVALRFEQKRAQLALVQADAEPESVRETRASQALDRALAQRIVQDASELQRALASAEGGVRRRRVELLELRFEHGLSIGEIAARWSEDPARVHHLYADAREDFRAALRTIVSERTGLLPSDAALERECDWMLEVLRSARG